MIIHMPEECKSSLGVNSEVIFILGFLLSGVDDLVHRRDNN